MRRRNGSQENSNLERELAAIDAALTGKRAEPELEDIARFVRLVAGERPRPAPQFTAELDARVRAGFPRGEASGPAQVRAPAALRLRSLPLAFGAAASLLIVVTAVVSSGILSGEDRGTLESGRPPAGETAAGGTSRERQPQPAQALGDEQSTRAATDRRLRGVPAPSASVAPGGPTRVLPHVRDRKVERDAALTLASPRDEIESTADGVIQVTDRYQGFVLRSSVSGGDEGRAQATLDLRIPSDRLQPALRDLSELAHVRSRTQTTQDITARFVSARSRLGDALVERRALLRQLARATTPNQTASIRARLRLASRQIATARSRLRGLRNRVDFSTVSVAIEADESLQTKPGGWSPGDALHDAIGILGTAVAVLLVSLAVLLPLSTLALLGWLASSRIRRERRERALEG